MGANSSSHESEMMLGMRIQYSARRENIHSDSINSLRDLLISLNLSRIGILKSNLINKEFTPGSFPNLRELNLGYNYWGDTDGKKLSEALNSWGSC